MTILFQLTELKSIWGISDLGRIINLLMLSFFLIIGFISFFKISYTKDAWLTIIIPSFLVVFGMLFNITKNVFTNTSLLSYYGLILPWGALLASPVLVKFGYIKVDVLWKHFYYFMIISISLSLLEYLFVFSSLYSIKSITIPNGVFLIGKFTLFHMLEDESPHERFYASFSEPGTLAMYLLPVILYSLLNKKYISLIVFLIAFYFTYSLGGYISLIILFFIFVYIKTKKTNRLLFLTLAAAMITLVGLFVADTLKQQYEEKGESADTRKRSVSQTFVNLSDAIISYPLGFNLKNTTYEYERDSLYFGSNFSIGYSYVLGGILAFVGYLWVVIFSFLYAIKNILLIDNDKYKHKYLIGVSILVLIPFIVQRTTIWDSVLFALLFSGVLVEYFNTKRLFIMK